MEPVRRVATAFCVARSRTLQAGTAGGLETKACSNFGNTIPEAVESCWKHRPTCQLGMLRGLVTGRSYTVGWARRAMLVVVTARTRGSVTSERVKWKSRPCRSVVHYRGCRGTSQKVPIWSGHAADAHGGHGEAKQDGDRAPQRGCILAFLLVPRWKSMSPGATYAGPCRAWLAWLVLPGSSQQANAKLTALLLRDSMRSCTKRRV